MKEPLLGASEPGYFVDLLRVWSLLFFFHVVIVLIYLSLLMLAWLFMHWNNEVFTFLQWVGDYTLSFM
jgi:hypothetical protein